MMMMAENLKATPPPPPPPPTHTTTITQREKWVCLSVGVCVRACSTDTTQSKLVWTRPIRTYQTCQRGSHFLGEEIHQFVTRPHDGDVTFLQPDVVHGCTVLHIHMNLKNTHKFPKQLLNYKWTQKHFFTHLNKYFFRRQERRKLY